MIRPAFTLILSSLILSPALPACSSSHETSDGNGGMIRTGSGASGASGASGSGSSGVAGTISPGSASGASGSSGATHAGGSDAGGANGSNAGGASGSNAGTSSGEGGSNAGGSSAGGAPNAGPGGSDNAGGASAGEGGSSAGEGGSSSGAAGESGVGGAAGGGSGAGGAPASGDKRIVGYFTAWGVYARDYHVPQIPADKLTHVNYAFANIADGKCVLGDAYADTDKAYPGDTWDEGAKRGSFHQLTLLKQSHPSLKTLISIGGWTWSAHYSDVAVSAESRATFAQSCVDFMVQWGFDGIDIDWEYPVGGGLDGNSNRPEDKQNYTLLLQEIRSRLETAGAPSNTHYLLTIAAPSGPDIIDHLDLPNLAAPLDWINLMSYDFHGGWETTTNFNAPLYPSAADPSPGNIATSFNVDAAVQKILATGVTPNKLVLGVPFYGHGWSGVPSANGGLYQSSTGLPQGTWEAGSFDWHDIKANYLPSYTRHWSDEAQVPWIYNASTQTMISYDDPQSIGLKASYIKSHDLGGAMFWELSGDDTQGSLIDALQPVLP